MSIFLLTTQFLYMLYNNHARVYDTHILRCLNLSCFIELERIHPCYNRKIFFYKSND